MRLKKVFNSENESKLIGRNGRSDQNGRRGIWDWGKLIKSKEEKPLYPLESEKKTKQRMDGRKVKWQLERRK